MTKLETAFDSVMEQARIQMSDYPWEDRSAYASWLSQTYYFVKHSSRLLALGAASASENDDALHRRMIDHLKEEMGHDKVAALDLRRLGFEVKNMPEFSVTKALYQNQYFALQNKSAISFLGYILVLEGIAATQGPALYARVEKAFGPKCTHFVKLHAEEDQTHVQTALKTVQGLSALDEQQVIENMNLSGDLYFLMLDKCRQHPAEDETLTAAKRRPVAANESLQL